MKKSILLMAGLVGLALTSCEDKSDLGTMQRNEAPVVVPADGVAIKSLYASDGNRISLQNYEESVFIPLIDIELSKDFPESSTVAGEVEIADNADFTDAVTISLTSQDAPSTNAVLAEAAGGNTRSLKGSVEVGAWESAFTTFYGYNPNPNVNYVRYKLWLTNDTQASILYNQDGEEWWDPMVFTVTPLDMKFDVAPAYTLYYTINGKTDQMAMYHNPANHVYDDPVFNAMVDVTENADETVNALEWWLAPSDNTDRTFGVLGDDPAVLSGALAELSEGAVKGQIDVPGTYKIEVNMIDKTFKVQIAPASLYVVSLSTITFANAGQLATEDYVEYEGMAGITAAWGLAGQAAYKPTLYVNDPDVEVDKSTATYKGGLKYETSGAPLNANSGIPIPGTMRGLYYITANLQTLTYTGYQCNSLGITGSMEAQNWGAGADEPLYGLNEKGDITTQAIGSVATQFMQWGCTLTVNAGDEWKIRANGDWAVNFGGANGGSYATDGSKVELSKDGANFVAEESGTFIVKVYLRRALDESGKMSPYYMTVTRAN